MSVKALTVRQPHASLVALGAKPIETRSWSTKYRGPLAIHAGAKRPPLMHLPPLHTHGSGRDRCRGGPDCWHWLVIDTITDPGFHGPRPQGSRVPKRAQTPTLFFPARGPHGRQRKDDGMSATEQETAVYLPLGAIVASCELVDVVPIVRDPENVSGPLAISTVHGAVHVLDSDGLQRDFPGQAPYGDFTPGRFAWLLDDVRPVDPPIPCRGYQGLWNVPDDVLAQLEGAAA